MHDICREAEVSPGALYGYFASKEALIAGICERNRSEFQSRFDDLATASDFMDALRILGERYFVEEPRHKQIMCVESGLESTRNPQVAEIYRSVDAYVADSFHQLFQRLADEGRIAPELDVPTLARVFSVIGDGMFWRRAVDPSFDAATLIPAVVRCLEILLAPQPPAHAAAPAERAAAPAPRSSGVGA
jgi:AcrR family transcriptional regulator